MNQYIAAKRYTSEVRSAIEDEVKMSAERTAFANDMRNSRRALLLLLCFLVGGELLSAGASNPHGSAPESFGDVIQTVGTVSPVIVLSSNHKQSLVAVSPKLQGRVLTSTADGWSGRSLGWVNGKLITSGTVQKHFNPYGGEDRLWLGPEAGQFSIFFAPNVPFDLAHWFTPAALDTEPFEVVRHSPTAVTFRRSFTVLNFSSTELKVQIDREVRILSREEIWKDLRLSPFEGLKVVAFESRNKLTNVGSKAWTKQTGLLSLWILGQFQASPSSTIVVPIHEGSPTDLGEPVNSDYFGHIPSDRLSAKPNIVYFKADAENRGKIGINPFRAKGVLASYDAQNRVLTLVQYTFPDAKSEYVNSAWKFQEDPYNGDVANAYNDGPPPSGGSRLGHFYELESSSPAAALSPGQSLEHLQRTIHLDGDEKQLDQVARTILGVGISEIQAAFPKRAAKNQP